MRSRNWQGAAALRGDASEHRQDLGSRGSVSLGAVSSLWAPHSQADQPGIGNDSCGDQGICTSVHRQSNSSHYKGENCGVGSAIP